MRARTIEIRSADDPATLAAARTLVRAHILAVSHSAARADRVVAALPAPYVAPEGGLWVAWLGTEPVGCVALQEIAPSIAELKRLYVRPTVRRLGIARHLTEFAVGTARERGYLRLRLGTLKIHQPAQRLYASLGFRLVEPYRVAEFGDTWFYELTLDRTLRVSRPLEEWSEEMPTAAGRGALTRNR